MNKKNLVIVFLGVFLVLLLVLVPTFAFDADDDADGTWCYLPGPPDPEDFNFAYSIGENDFLTGSYVSDWTGTFSGSSHDNGFVIWQNPADGPAIFVDVITFDEVEVGGKTGGLVLYVYGERQTSAWEPGPWFIAGASGELEGLAGRGQWWPGDEKIGCPEGYLAVYYSVDTLEGIDFNVFLPKISLWR